MSISDTASQITGFLNSVGINTRFSQLEIPTFLPGLYIEQGKLVIDVDRLTYPGDMLHEAGHIAVTPPDKRPLLTGDVHRCGHGPAEEMAAIAWSWAALKNMALPADILFHPEGYKGGSQNYIEAFESHNYFGYPMLVYWGLTNNPDESDGFPKMLQWVRT
ncbi:hypothetical protein [Hahella ganghwensis]|uniref:hypothetical protein n=1 Tax=Hahella ganghwensis TaxID=286420 RepID=UPI000379F26F|nr:hypothetical protein [Hahella ganghwensis]